MGYPNGVSLAVVSGGTAFTAFGDDVPVQITVTPRFPKQGGGFLTRIVHAATGWVMTSDSDTFTAEAGTEVSFSVPHVDQAGFRDPAQNAYTGWYYEVKVVVGAARGRTKTAYTQTVSPVVGQALVDLDLVPEGQTGDPQSVAVPEVVSVNGMTGAVTIESGANDADIAALLQDPGTSTGLTLQSELDSERQTSDASYAPIVTPPLAAAIEDPVASLAVQVLGDSTGNETDEWVHLTAIHAATKGAAFEVRHHRWDDVNQNMARPIVVQPAPAGERHIPFQGTAQSFPTFNGPPITGDIDVRVRVEPDAWASGAEQALVGQFPESSENRRAWYFAITPSGALQFQWSTDGTTLQTLASSGAWTPAAGPLWVRVVLDAVDGSSHTIRFYSSPDGTNWSQVNSGISRSGTTSIYSSDAPYQLGGRGLAAGPFVGKIFEVEVRNGWTNDATRSDFGTVVPCLPEHWTATPATPSPVGSPILTFVNGSHPGATISYLSDPARMAKMTPDYGQKLILISSSHNEASLHGQGLREQVESFAAAVAQQLPGVPFGLVTQNPRISPADRIVEQSHRRLEYLSWCQDWGWTVVDTYGKFLSDPRGVSALVDPDGFHPNADGSQVWADEVQRVLGI